MANVDPDLLFISSIRSISGLSGAVVPYHASPDSGSDPGGLRYSFDELHHYHNILGLVKHIILLLIAGGSLRGT
jgi:hypothetical protein